MDTATNAATEKADAATTQAQGDLSALSVSAGGRGDREDQSDPTRLGQLLRQRPIESVFLLHQKMGKRDAWAAAQNESDCAAVTWALLSLLTPPLRR